MYAGVLKLSYCSVILKPDFSMLHRLVDNKCLEVLPVVLFMQATLLLISCAIVFLQVDVSWINYVLGHKRKLLQFGVGSVQLHILKLKFQVWFNIHTFLFKNYIYSASKLHALYYCCKKSTDTGLSFVLLCH